MHPLKRRASALLWAALALAVLTPAYIAVAVPYSSPYYRLRRATVLLVTMQALPYVVCAAIWLPSRSEIAPKTAFRLSLLLFLAAALLYLPLWIHPWSGGDMVGLFYILVCMVTTGAVVVISVLVLVAHWYREKARRKERDARP